MQYSIVCDHNNNYDNCLTQMHLDTHTHRHLGERTSYKCSCRLDRNEKTIEDARLSIVLALNLAGKVETVETRDNEPALVLA